MVSEVVKRRKKENLAKGVPASQLDASGFQRNPADIASGFVASEAPIRGGGQKTATEAETKTFEAGGGTVQEQRRVGQVQQDFAEQQRQEVLQGAVRRGETVSGQIEQAQLTEERVAPVLNQGLLNQELVNKDILAGQEQIGSPEITEENFARNVFIGTTASLAVVGLGAVALAAGSAGGAVTGLSSILPTTMQHGRRLLAQSPQLLNRQSLQIAKGITKGLQDAGIANTKNLGLMQRVWRRIGGTGSAGLIAIAAIGATYGIAKSTVERATFLSGQASDDTVDTISGLNFAQAEFKRSGNLEAALEITKFTEEVQQKINESSSFMDQFNMWKAGNRKMETDLKIIRKRGELIKKQIREDGLTPTDQRFEQNKPEKPFQPFAPPGGQTVVAPGVAVKE